MDVEELELWEREAARLSILRRVDAAKAARIGQATQEGYEDMMRRYQDALDEVNGSGRADDQDLARLEWAMMRAKGRG